MAEIKFTKTELRIQQLKAIALLPANDVGGIVEFGRIGQHQLGPLAAQIVVFEGIGYHSDRIQQFDHGSVSRKAGIVFPQ